MIPDIGFSLQPQYDRPLPQVVALLKKHGFSAVSPLWSPELDMVELEQCIRNNQMVIQSLHAPHKGILHLWQPDSPLSSEVYKNSIDTIDACAQFEVPVVVLHSCSGFDYTFSPETLDFRLFDRIVAYARDNGVSIAFENLQGEEFLNALMTRYRNEPRVGFCWDSGHEHCYPHKTDFLEAFGDRLIMTHLNDNLGTRDPSGTPTSKDDLHYLPHDGKIDWSHAIQRLQKASMQTILNFELKQRPPQAEVCDLRYLQLSLEQFIEAASIRAKQIAQKYAEMLKKA